MKPLASSLALWGALCVTPILSATRVQWICSTEASPWKLMPAPSVHVVEPGLPPDVFVKPQRVFQVIDGFGGCFNELGWIAIGKAPSAERRKALEALFGDDGCAFTLGRIPIGSSDFAINLEGDPSTPDDDAYSLDDTPGDYDLKHFSIERDRQHLLPYIKTAMAIRPDLQCWASPWSPPEWMKDNDFYAGGSLRWERAILQAYANYFSKWIKAYQAEGVHIYAVIPQNEPNQSQPFPSCVYTGDQLAEFIGDYLGPTLKKQNPDIELWFGINGDPQNDGDNFNDRVLTVLEDPKANAFLTGIAFQYDSKNQIATAHELYPDKKLMQSESVCFNGDNNWDQALELYRLIKRHLDGGANQYFAWNMILDETGMGPWNWRQNAPITVNSRTGQVTYNGECHVYKHFSHFVKPGARRIASTGLWGGKIAFKNADGSVVLVMSNDSENNHECRVTLSGFTTKNSIKVEIPARSINTFVITPR